MDFCFTFSKKSEEGFLFFAKKLFLGHLACRMAVRYYSYECNFTTLLNKSEIERDRRSYKTHKSKRFVVAGHMTVTNQDWSGEESERFKKQFVEDYLSKSVIYHFSSGLVMLF